MIISFINKKISVQMQIRTFFFILFIIGLINVTSAVVGTLIFTFQYVPEQLALTLAEVEKQKVMLKEANEEVEKLKDAYTVLLAGAKEPGFQKKVSNIPTAKPVKIPAPATPSDIEGN